MVSYHRAQGHSMTSFKSGERNITVGGRLRERRLRAKLSPRIAAKRLGIHITQLWRLETGTCAITIEILAAYSKMVRCEPEEIVKGIST